MDFVGDELKRVIVEDAVEGFFNLAILLRSELLEVFPTSLKTIRHTCKSSPIRISATSGSSMGTSTASPISISKSSIVSLGALGLLGN